MRIVVKLPERKETIGEQRVEKARSLSYKTARQIHRAIVMQKRKQAIIEKIPETILHLPPEFEEASWGSVRVTRYASRAEMLRLRNVLFEMADKIDMHQAKIASLQDAIKELQLREKRRETQYRKQESHNNAVELRKMFGLPLERNLESNPLKELAGLISAYAEEGEDATELVRSVRDRE